MDDLILTDLPDDGAMLPEEILDENATHFYVSWMPVSDSCINIHTPEWVEKGLINHKLVEAWNVKTLARKDEDNRFSNKTRQYGLGYYQKDYVFFVAPITSSLNQTPLTVRPRSPPTTPAQGHRIYSSPFCDDIPVPTVETALTPINVVPALGPDEPPAPEKVLDDIRKIRSCPKDKTNGMDLPFRSWLAKELPQHFLAGGKGLQKRSTLLQYSLAQLGISQRFWDWISGTSCAPGQCDNNRTLEPGLVTPRASSSKSPAPDHDVSQQFPCNQVLTGRCEHRGDSRQCDTHPSPFLICQGCRSDHVTFIMDEAYKSVVRSGAKFPVCVGCVANLKLRVNGGYKLQHCKCDTKWTCVQCREVELSTLMWLREAHPADRCGFCVIHPPNPNIRLSFCLSCKKFSTR